MSLPTSLYLGPAAVCALSWFGLGSLLLRHNRSGNRLLDVLSRFGIGAGTLSLILFVLGRVGLFRPWVLVVLTFALAATAIPALVAELRQVSRPTRPPTLVAAVASLTALALVLDLVGGATPPTSVDALAYHVELPHYWLGIGRVDDPFWTFAGFYPLGVEMLFAQGLALAGGAAASAEHAILGVLAALATFGLARELGRGRAAAGVLGSSLFVLEGTFTWDATSTFVEMGLAFYGVLAVWLAVRYAKCPALTTAVLAGLAAGAAAAAKNVGLLLDLVLLCALGLYALLRVRRPWHAVAAVGGAFVLGAYWYLRDWIVTGNPVYPLLFGGKDFTPYFRQYLQGSATIYPGTHGRNPLRILMLPLDLVLHGERFDRGEYVGIGILILGAIGVWLLRRERVAMAVATGAAVYLIAWWYAIPQVRYLIPDLAVIAALAGAALGPLLTRHGRARVALTAALCLVVLDWAAPSAALERQLLPAAFGAESQRAAVQRLVGTYDALYAIQRRVGAHALVGFIGYRWPFWYPGRAIWLGWPAFSPDVPSAVLRERLQSEHVDYAVAWMSKPEGLLPVHCYRRIGSFPARYVTSRSRGESQSIRLYLFSMDGCYR